MYGDKVEQLATCQAEALEVRLDRQLTNAKLEVLRLEELITLLNNNPDFKRILELMGGAGRF